MWRAFLLFTIILVSTVSGSGLDTSIFSDVATNSSVGSFTSPNETHHQFLEYGDMTISWSTSLDAIIVILYQEDIEQGKPIIHMTTQTEGEVTWNASSIRIDNGSSSDFVLRALDGLGQLADSNRSEEFWSRKFTIYRASNTPGDVSASAQETGARFESGSNKLPASTGGLSLGLTVGLAATFTAGSVAIVVYLICLFYKRRRAKGEKSKLSPAGSHRPGDDLPELCTYEPVPHGSPTNPAEMEVKPAEMEGTRTYAELPAELRELPDVRDLDELVIERHS